MAIIETEISYIEELPDGIIKVSIKPNLLVEPQHLDESYRILYDLTGGKPSPFLIIFHPDSDATLEARKRFADKKRNELKSIEAFVIQSLAQRLIAKFHINMHKYLHPIKVFSNEEDALKWLRENLE